MHNPPLYPLPPPPLIHPSIPKFIPSPYEAPHLYFEHQIAFRRNATRPPEFPSCLVNPKHNPHRQGGGGSIDPVMPRLFALKSHAHLPPRRGCQSMPAGVIFPPVAICSNVYLTRKICQNKMF